MLLNLTRSEIEAIAPDEAVLRAGEELAWSGRWMRVGRIENLLWGEYQGSRGGAYRMVAELAVNPLRLLRVDCNCPSRKRPCKHLLGLILKAEGGHIEPGQPDDSGSARSAEDPFRWVEQAARTGSRSGPGRSVGERSNASTRRVGVGNVQRDKRVTGGLLELDVWLTRLVTAGLAVAIASPGAVHDDWERMVRRMVDTQAPGLAARLRLAWRLLEEGRIDRLLEELALIHLACSAFQKIDNLSALAQADLRAFIGWSQRREMVLASPPIADQWQVLGRVEEASLPIQHQRIWLQGLATGRVALLIDYGDEANRDLCAGRLVAGELRYFPSGWSQRAVLDRPEEIRSNPTAHHPDGRSAPLSILHSLERYALALAGNPWLEYFPMFLAAVELRNFDGTWFVTDRQGDRLPLATRRAERAGGASNDDNAGKNRSLLPWRMLAIGGDRPLDIFGEWDGRAFLPLASFDGRTLTDLSTGLAAGIGDD